MRPKNADVKKVCKGCNMEFTVPYVLRNRRTFCSKKCSCNDKELIERKNLSSKQTFLKKYGGHPMLLDRVKKKLSDTCQQKYGTSWYSKSKEWIEKKRRTSKERYGDENYTNREKTIKTMIERYGVDNPHKNQEIKDQIKQTKYNNHYNNIVEYCKENKLEALFTIDDYNGYKFNNKYKFKCTECNYVFEHVVCNIESLYCSKCMPDRRLGIEGEILNFLNEVLPDTVINRHDRSILYGKELDFVIPEKNIAIEHNGLYWHSENGQGIGKNYHLNKTKSCLAHGIRLLHIYENEWRDHTEVVKNVLKKILKVGMKNIKGDVLEIGLVTDKKEKREFLINNNIFGNDNSNVQIGLYSYCNELLSIMTFAKRNKGEYWELSRHNDKNGLIVDGSYEILFKHFIDTYKPEKVISYNDRRYFSGDMLLKLGFKFIKNTEPTYYYISPDYKNIFHRMKFYKHLQAKMLAEFDINLSEKENMINNGYDRIYNCGYSKWMWSK